MGGGKFITQWTAKNWTVKIGMILAAVVLLLSPCLAQHGNSHPAQGHSAPPAGARPPAQSHQPARPPAQGRHAGDWLRQHQNMSPVERQRALENDPGFRHLSPERQQQLRQQLQRFSNMPREQQQRVLNRMDVWAHMTPEQKQQMRDVHNQIQQLPPERQRMVRTAITDLRAMPPQQREQIIDSARFKGMFSEHERDIMRGATRLPLAPPEGPPPE